MHWIRKLKWTKLLFLIVPITAYAISWSMNGFKAPDFFREAARSLGLRVTQVCRPNNASYGATRSLHKRCLAMDLGRETPRSKIDALRQYGLCGQFHKKGYYGATADHWHVTKCSDAASRRDARRDQQGRAESIRKNKRHGRPSASAPKPRWNPPKTTRRSPVYTPRSSYGYDDDWKARAFGTR